MTIKNLVRGGAIIITGTLVGSVASYLYNTQTGRLLGTEYYGSYTSLLSLLAIIAVPTAAIQTIAAKKSSDYLVDKNFGQVKNLVATLHRRLWPIGLAVSLVLALASPWIARFLNIEDIWPVVILAGIFLFAFLLPITRGTIQGMQLFFQLSVSTSIEAVFRLLIGLTLITLGFALRGAILAVVVGTMLAYLFSFLPIRSVLKYPKVKINKKDIVQYSIPTVIVILCLTALVNVDIVMAKHYLPSTEAGYYGALSTIAKIIFYFSGPIVGVMFPMISDLYNKGERHFHLLLTTLFTVFGASLAILVVFMLAPMLTIRTLYSDQFTPVWPYLASMGLVMLIYGLVNVMVNYFLSINSMRFVPYLIFFTLLELGLIVLFHASIDQFVIILMLTQIGLLLTLFIIYIVTKWPVILSKIEERTSPN